MGLFDIFDKAKDKITHKTDNFESFNEDSYRASCSYNDDTPGYDSHAYPDCPLCDATMGYSYVLDEFKCPNCGYIMDGDKYDGYDLYDDDGMPWACSACGGPWPDCVDSCKLYDED